MEKRRCYNSDPIAELNGYLQKLYASPGDLDEVMLQSLIRLEFYLVDVNQLHLMYKIILKILDINGEKAMKLVLLLQKHASQVGYSGCRDVI